MRTGGPLTRLAATIDAPTDHAPPRAEELRRHFGAVEDALIDTVAEGQRDGGITAPGDARTLARQVLSTYYGPRVLARVQKDRQALLAVADSALAAL
ncbi:hypothetical protein ACIQXD_10665 [Streptomyces uncialis]|uniref:hypothetical protein n=1 Tax=Streptomyces uncialis TaxID=1048205 RepID=UPI0037F33229